MFSSFALKKLECKCYQWCESETNIFILGQKTMKKVRVWVMKFFSSKSLDVKTFIASPLMKKRRSGSQVDSLFDQRSCHFFWQGHPDNQGWQLSLRSKLKLISSQNIFNGVRYRNIIFLVSNRGCVYDFLKFVPPVSRSFDSKLYWAVTLLIW